MPSLLTLTTQQTTQPALGPQRRFGRQLTYDLTGLRFGRLTVLRRAARSGAPQTFWLCRCDCLRLRPVASHCLRKGLTVSCGCYQIEQTIKRFRRHGGSGHPIYRVWNNMMARCHRRSYARWADYGGRGIKVCLLWRWSFLAFKRHVGHRPLLGGPWTLDRIDNDGDYRPGNVRWATHAQQSRNRRPSRLKKRP